MSKFAFYIIPLITLSCNSTDLKLNYKNTEVVAYNLIKLSVDTIINKNAEINTPNYILDLTSISNLNQKGSYKFISNKNQLLPTTTEDSTVIFENRGYDFRVKKSMIIKIHKIKDIEGGLTKVNITKMISTYKQVEMDLYLKRFNEGYQINSCLSKYINKDIQ